MLGGFLPPPAHRVRPRGPDQAAFQRRHHRRQPPADAAQRRRAREDARALPHLRSRPVHHRRRRRAALVHARCLHDIRDVSRTRSITAWTARRINYMRNSVKAVVDAYDGTTTFYVFDSRGSDHRGVSRHVPEPLQGRLRDAAVAQQARPLPGADAAAPGGGLRPVPYDRSGDVLQPRGSLERRHRGRRRTRSVSRPRRRWSRTSC